MWSEMTRHRMIRKLINLLVTDLLHTSAADIAASGIESLDDVRRCDHLLIHPSDEMRAKDRQLKSFLYQNMYRHYRV
ncbi:hypothetical protein LMP57_13540, partial [Staphylococcus aureus]|uniref:hypothetical protein n=1 Tax=Staphylococcus aureus TaxID=1280 RepID=UPI001E33CC18